MNGQSEAGCILILRCGLFLFRGRLFLQPVPRPERTYTQHTLGPELGVWFEEPRAVIPHARAGGGEEETITDIVDGHEAGNGRYRPRTISS